MKSVEYMLLILSNNQAELDGLLGVSYHLHALRNRTDLSSKETLTCVCDEASSNLEENSISRLCR